MNSFFLKSRQLIDQGRGKYGLPVEHKISQLSGLPESHYGNAQNFSNTGSSCGDHTIAAHPPRARLLLGFRSDYKHPVPVTDFKDCNNEVRGSKRRSVGFDWTREWTRDHEPHPLPPFPSRYFSAAAFCRPKEDCDRDQFPIYEAERKSVGLTGLGKDLMGDRMDGSGDEDQLSTDDDCSGSSPLGIIHQSVDQAVTTCAADGGECMTEDDRMRVHPSNKTLRGSSGVPSASSSSSSSSSSLIQSTSIVYPWMRKLQSTSGNWLYIHKWNRPITLEMHRILNAAGTEVRPVHLYVYNKSWQTSISTSIHSLIFNMQHA